MRLLLVSHSPKNPDAGASRVYHLLEEGLISRGHAVKVLHLEDLRLPQFATRPIMRLLLPYAASRRAKRELVERYDVIMCSNGTLYPLFRRLRARSNRALLVNHLHGLSFFDYQAVVTERMRGHISQSLINRSFTGTLPQRWDSMGSLLADLTLVQNERDLDFMSELGFVRAVKIPLSIHPEILLAGIVAPEAEGRDPNRLLWFGSWTERKGIHYIPRAFATICEKHPDARLTIGGTGLPESVIRCEFSQSVRSRVNVLPRLSRKEQIEEFSQHCIFLFPSLSEGFGYALLEAMSMGLAVITTQTGFGGDFLRDGKNCRMVPFGSSLHLANATDELMNNHIDRHRIAKNGQELSRSFTTNRFIDSYEDTFSANLSELQESQARHPQSRPRMDH